MTKKKKNSQRLKSNEQSDELLTHITRLNLASVEAYQAWCRDNHFTVTLAKSRHCFDKELEHYRSTLALAKLKRHKQDSNLQNIIRKLYRKEISQESLDNPILKSIYQGFNRIHPPKVLLNSLLYLEAASDLLKEATHVDGVIALTAHYQNWLRPLKDWQPKSHNAQRQFSALARHLLANYDVPIFMDTVWFTHHANQQDWFIHIGKGHNIRTATELPIPLTKKMAHYFLTAPDNYSVEAALRWGQVHALGGDKRLCSALLDTRLIQHFQEDEFWLSVIRFFIQNPMLDPVHINPIIDYIWHQKYENRIVFVDRGVAEQQGPEQPNFSMQKRTPQSLLSQVEKWHRKLGKESKGGKLQWIKSSIDDFEFIEGQHKHKNMKIWRIRELVSSQELIAEGRALSHCVATYANSCHKGRSAIWTMDMEDQNGLTKLLTIEVNLSAKLICQIRGKQNRLPTQKEVSIIRRWETKEGLKISGMSLI